MSASLHRLSIMVNLLVSFFLHSKLMIETAHCTLLRLTEFALLFLLSLCLCFVKSFAAGIWVDLTTDQGRRTLVSI